MKTYCMVDIETMSSRNDAAVIAIGAVTFDETGVHDSQGYLAMIDPIWAIGDRDGKTKDWWFQQPPTVRKAMFGGTKNPIEVALGFTAWMKNAKLSEVWANPPQFDLTILRCMYDRLKEPFPVHYKTERDFRTLCSIGKALKIDTTRDHGTEGKHNALADAIAQARVAHTILTEIGAFGTD